MTKQRPPLKKGQIAALGGVIVVLAIIITVGTINEKANEQAAPTAAPMGAPVATETTTPGPVATETAEPDQVLTVNNNEDLAALLAGPEHGKEVEAFASKYQGRTIEFDGNIAAMDNHGDYKTRYDFLILPGNYGESPMAGPNFQFRNVGVFDLHLVGPSIPASVRVGDNLHIVAEVDDYNDVQGLFFLDPISTKIR